MAILVHSFSQYLLRAFQQRHWGWHQGCWDRRGQSRPGASCVGQFWTPHHRARLLGGGRRRRGREVRPPKGSSLGSYPHLCDDGGVSGWFSSGGPRVRFLTRYDGEVSEPLVGVEGQGNLACCSSWGQKEYSGPSA